MPEIRPITELRNTNEISEACHKQKEPIYITKNGYGDLVIMGIEVFEQLFEASTLDASIAEAEAEYEREGKLLDARDALKGLRRRHLG